ncbi:MAG: 4Fe-4S binding protein [Candidatus Thorarchaeota archaeon]
MFFKNSLRYVDYDKCEGCLKCVTVCEHGAIEVISIEDGKLKGFKVDPEKCTLCKICLNDDFCFQSLFELQTDNNENKRIKFKKTNYSECYKCLKYFKNCPNNAILPVID